MRRSLPACGLLSAFLFLLPVHTAPAAQAPATPALYKPSDVIVILGAVPQEITVFTVAMGNPPQELLWGIPYYRGKLSNINLGGDVGISHIAMDKSPKIKAEIERTILAVPQTR